MIELNAYCFCASWQSIEHFTIEHWAFNLKFSCWRFIWCERLIVVIAKRSKTREIKEANIFGKTAYWRRRRWPRRQIERQPPVAAHWFQYICHQIDTGIAVTVVVVVVGIAIVLFLAFLFRFHEMKTFCCEKCANKKKNKNTASEWEEKGKNA